MMSSTVTPQTIYEELQTLSDESLTEIWQFIEFLRFKHQHPPSERVVQLGGLLRDYHVDITEEDIVQARKEMWNALGDIRE